MCVWSAHVTLTVLIMRILDRYIVREVFRHAFLGLIVFTFVFFVPQLVRLTALFVRHTGSGAQIAELFLCIFPGVFAFTTPMAILIGVLLGLGRMSADSEIIALSALGIGRRRILVPVGVLATTGAIVTLAMTLWLAPLALETFRSLEAELTASQINFAVQPRVFDERFPHEVLYVNDISASGTQWRGVFLAETGGENGSRLTLAESAIVIAEPKYGKLELHLKGGTTHDFDRADPDHYSVTAFGQSDWPIEVTGLVPDTTGASDQERRAIHARTRRGSRPELAGSARRVAAALCVSRGVLCIRADRRADRGATSTRRTRGRIVDRGAADCRILPIADFRQRAGARRYTSAGGGLVDGERAADSLRAGAAAADGTVSERGAVVPVDWEGSGPGCDSAGCANRVRGQPRRRGRRMACARKAKGARSLGGSFPRLMDLYLLRRFFWYFVLLMGAFVFLFEAFTFFELLDDIARHHVAFLTVVDYFGSLTPYLLYQLAPLAALVATLVTVGVMSKNNEIVACKASGISLYRLAGPLLLAGIVLASTMILVDDTYLPYANQRQDALRNQIKGRPPQTYRQPERWIFGENAKIYNYDLFDPNQSLFGGLSVVEIDPTTFQVRRRVFASRAQWSEAQNLWVLESGWVRDFSDGVIKRYERFNVKDLPELTEPPSYFHREVRQAFQMNWSELRRYIDGLHRAGFDVATLTVQLHRKLAFPLIAPISMLLAFPFAFLVGTRGAVGGVAIGVAIGILYWLGAELLTAMGGVGQLPPLLAGWAPDIIFFFLGLYFFFRMPT